MPKPQRDPLLLSARIMLNLAMGLCTLIAGASLIAAPILIAWRDGVIRRIAAEGAPPETIWAIVTVLGLLAICAGLAFFFFRHLYRIVGTVSAGAPFVPINAERLSAMGWIAVATQIILIPMKGLGGWIEHVTGHVRIDIDVSLGGILLALVLFILARVFREGARMRADLEGTV